MGKCASKDVVNGQIVPETELDAGSPMFAPEAPPAGGETATAGGEITVTGFAPAPVDPVAAALPTDPRGHDVDYAGAQYAGGYQMRPSATSSHVKTEHISSNQIFNTLEEAEEAARKQNQAWGVDHLPYDPKASQAQYGNTYASAFPPSSSVYQQPAPTDPRPVAPAPQQPEHHQPRYDQTRPAEPYPAPAADAPQARASGAFNGGAAVPQQPPAAVEYEAPVAVPVTTTAAEQPLAPEHHIPAAAMPAEPLTGAAPVTVPVEEDLSKPSEETPSKKKKKKSKKSSKGKNWAWF